MKPNFASLLLLGTEMGLALSDSFQPEEVLGMIRNAALKQSPPSSQLSLQVVREYGIVFGKAPMDCMGFWENGNVYCARCRDAVACSRKGLDAGMGSLANPAIQEFGANDDHAEMRKPSPTTAVQDQLKKAEEDRNSLVAWIDSQYTWLLKRTYSNSITYRIPSMNSAVLKVEVFNRRRYDVCMPSCTDEMASSLGLLKTAYGWYSITTDLDSLKNNVASYLDHMKAQVKSGATQEGGGLREELIAMAQSYGCKVDFYSNYQTVRDSNNIRVLYLERFTPKCLRCCFCRIHPDDVKVNQLSLSHNQYGFSYCKSDAQELRELMTYYFEQVLLLSKTHAD